MCLVFGYFWASQLFGLISLLQNTVARTLMPLKPMFDSDTMGVRFGLGLSKHLDMRKRKLDLIQTFKITRCTMVRNATLVSLWLTYICPLFLWLTPPPPSPPIRARWKAICFSVCPVYFKCIHHPCMGIWLSAYVLWDLVAQPGWKQIHIHWS